jgi:CRISPR-associated protein Cmr4
MDENNETGTDEPIYITSDSKLDYANKVFLEDLNFITQKTESTKKWAVFLANILFKEVNWKTIFIERLAIISNESFSFITDTGTDVSAHIKIDDAKKTTAKGALWYEESLPTEAILAGVSWCDRVLGKVDCKEEKESKEEQLLGTYCQEKLHLQIGGKATVGKGRISCIFSNG